MKIQKGIVKYKDRNDIVCTYGVADDGTQYYFLDEADEKKMSNGNRIATTALVEAVDSMAKATHIGVIDKDGKVVVPFDNKAIKPVNDNVLIVEKAFPTSQAVLDAIELRNDTVSAPKLVSTSAALKDKMNAKMGAEGRFMVNDQFSEATVCDIDGKNLVNDQYYSYIGVAGDELYLSTNVVDSDIVEFSLTDMKIKESAKSDEVIDVGNAMVDPQTVENALVQENAPAVDAFTPPVSNPMEGMVPPATEAAPQENVQEDMFASSSVPAPTENMQQGFSAPPLGFEDFFKGEGGPTDAPITPEAPVNEAPTNMNVPVTPEVPVDTLVEENAAEAPTVPEIPTSEEIANDVVDISNIQTSSEEHSTGNGLPFTDFTPPLIDAEEVAKSTASTEVEEVKTEEEKTSPLENSEEVIPETKEVETEEVHPEEAPVEEVEKVSEEQEVVEEKETLPEEKEIKEEAPVEEKISEDKVEIPPVGDVNPEEEDLEKVDVEVNDGVNSFDHNIIDPSEVASTVDKDNNGILDSDEIIHSTTKKVIEDDLDLDSHYYHTDPLNDMEEFGSYRTNVTSDNIMSDVVKSMSDLMRQNREQKSTIAQVQSRLEESESQKRALAERYKEQSMRYENLTTKLRSLDGLTSRLETKVREQGKTIDAQERELKALRSQLNSKQDLVKLLADAKVLLEEDKDYSYSTEDSYYRRSA